MAHTSINAFMHKPTLRTIECVSQKLWFNFPVVTYYVTAPFKRIKSSRRVAAKRFLVMPLWKVVSSCTPCRWRRAHTCTAWKQCDLSQIPNGGSFRGSGGGESRSLYSASAWEPSWGRLHPNKTRCRRAPSIYGPANVISLFIAEILMFLSRYA